MDNTIEKCQFGFTKGKDHSMALAQIMTLLMEHRHEGRSCMYASLDLRKMFPSISLIMVISEMITRGANIDDIQFFVKSSLGRSCILKDGDYLYSDNVVFDGYGAREGSVDAAPLAKLLQSLVSRPLETSGFGIPEKRVVYHPVEREYSIEEGKRCLTLVADDSALSEEDPAGMQNLFQAFKDTAKISRVSVNKKKTKVLAFGKDAEKMREEWDKMFASGQVDVEAVDELEYWL